MKIKSNGQLVTLLTVCHIFSLLSYDRFTETANPVMYMAGTVVSYILLGISAIPMLYLLKDKDNLYNTGISALGKTGYIFNIYFILVLLIVAMGHVSNFEFFVTSTIYNGVDNLVVLALIITSVVFCVLSGIQAIKRVSLFVLLFFGLSIMLTVFPLIKEIKIENYASYNPDTLPQFLNIVRTEYFKNIDVLLFAYLAQGAKKVKSFYGYLASMWGITLGAELFMYGVLGRYITEKMFPLFTLSTISEFSVFERMDAFHLGSFACVTLIRLAVYVWVISQLIKETFNIKDKLSVYITATVLTAGSIFITSSVDRIMFMSSVTEYTGAVLVTLVAYPIVIQIANVLKRRKLN